MRQKQLFISILTTLLFVATGANSTELPADGIAAIVGDEIILLSDVHQQMEITAQQMQMTATRVSTPPTPKQIETQALENIIDDLLVKQQAREMQIETSNQEVESAIANMAAQNNMDLETFRNALEAQGTSLEQYKVNMRSDLLKYKVMNMRVRSRINISEDKARDFYNTQVRDVRRSASFEGAHILIRVPKDSRAIEVSKFREKAVSFLEQIKSGKKTFEQLAKKFSQDTITAKWGGHLGERMPGEIPSVLDNSFLDMEPGELSEPVRTAAGFHILKLVKREDVGVKPFSEVKAIIIGQLTQKEMERQQVIWLNELRKKTFINIRI